MEVARPSPQDLIGFLYHCANRSPTRPVVEDFAHMFPQSLTAFLTGLHMQIGTALQRFAPREIEAQKVNSFPANIHQSGFLSVQRQSLGGKPPCRPLQN